MDFWAKEIGEYVSKLNPADKARLVDNMAAVSELHPNDKCWCGSGIKFRACHLNRDRERVISRTEEAHIQSSFFNKNKLCCATYDASNCHQEIKGAHTIQRGRVLESFSKNGHVGTFYRNHEGKTSEKDVKIGTRKGASIFYGFCNYHDTVLFRDIENEDFSASYENCWSSSYRSVCHEFYQKNAAMEAIDWKIRHLDSGRPLMHQLIMQSNLQTTKRDIAKGLKDALAVKDFYESIKVNGAFNEITSLIIEFDVPLTVAVSGSISPYYDLQGKRLQNFPGITAALEYLTLSTLCTEGCAVYCISSLKSDEKTNSYLQQLSNFNPTALKNWLFTSIFCHIENTYFNLDWWGVLPNDQQVKISEIALMDGYSKPLEYDDFPANVIPGAIKKITLLN
jgi:hypothetical protein